MILGLSFFAKSGVITWSAYVKLYIAFSIIHMLEYSFAK